MIKDEILQSPGLQLAADSSRVLNYKRDPQNYITQLFGQQLPAIQNGFFNVHMTKGIIVQPHWHTNATEMVFVISGEVITSVFDPFTQKLISYKIQPGQVSIFPKGWFHWIITESEHVHLLTIFDVPTPDIVYGSDFLRFTPKEVMHRAYCVNEEAYARAVAPIKESVILGPPVGCEEKTEAAAVQPNVMDNKAAHTNEAKGNDSYRNDTFDAPFNQPLSGFGAQDPQSLMTETLRTIEPWVMNGLREAQAFSPEHVLREATAVSYLIGKGYDMTAAQQIVESWRRYY